MLAAGHRRPRRPAARRAARRPAARRAPRRSRPGPRCPPEPRVLAAAGAREIAPGAAAELYARTWADTSLDVNGIESGDARAAPHDHPLHRERAPDRARWRSARAASRSRRRWSASCARRRPPGAEIELDVEPGEPAGFDAADPVLALAREAIGRAAGSAAAVRAHRRLDPDPRSARRSAASRRCCPGSRSTPTASTAPTRATGWRASRSASGPRASSTRRSRRLR